jgi:hypothetical protein
MIITSYSNIDFIQGNIGYGNTTEGITDWRIENTSNGIFNILNSSSIIQPFGGISEIGQISNSTDRYMIFKEGTSTFYVPPGGIICDLLVVGGGGGGGQGQYESGGGGAGGIVYMVNKTFVSGTYNVIVGKGGATGTVGGDSSITLNNTPISFDGISIVGKGGGAAGDPGGNGGSGGGGNYNQGFGIATQGNTFWNGSTYVAGGFDGQSGGGYSGGGGGGAGEAGGTDGGLDGGDGRIVSITGYSVFYGGGGAGGGSEFQTIGIGGEGGGGNAAQYAIGSAGTPNTGGGGSGGDIYYSGRAGGSGIVILRYSIVNTSIPNISIIDNGNLGFGIFPISSSSKLEIIGDINISGIYKINNSDVIQNTSNYIATIRDRLISSIYHPIVGNGIAISSESSPNISLTQWITSGINLYYIDNVSIGTINNYNKLTISQGTSGTTGALCFPLKIFLTSVASNTFNNTGTLIGLGTTEGVVKCAIGHTRVGTWDRGSIVFLCNNIADNTDASMANEVMRITNLGRIGIGLTNPSYYLDVFGGTGTSGTITRRYFNSTNASGSQPQYGTGSNSVTLKVNGSIWSIRYIVSSDIRIKEDIQDIIDDTALYKILSIEPKTYKYIDKIERGDKKVYGFISQQIKEVIPEAVSIQKSYIPNIMLLANYNNKIITLHSLPNYVIKINDKIKCFDKNNKDVFIEVEEIIDSLNFRIKELDNPYTDTTIFVYGIEVEDFHILDKSYIYTLNVCATQELYKRIESLNAITQLHKESINELKAKVLLLLNNTSI